jgi:hypothetical protein
MNRPSATGSPPRQGGDTIETKECNEMLDSSQVLFRRRAVLLNAVLVFGGVALATRAAKAADAAPVAEPALSASITADAAPIVKTIAELGVELVGVRLSASDFLIDLRYRVKDIAKAQSLLERKVQPVLVNEATGDRYYIPQVPKIGALRQSATAKQPAQLDRVYFMLFANPDRKLRSGEKVTLYAGDSVVRDLVVQ